MSGLEGKLKKLEEATASARSVLSTKESELASASNALSKAKAKLMSLDAESQRTLLVNDTDLPELISAELAAREEYDEAKTRYETNQKYSSLFRDRISKEE
jgi:hypothetical protein